MPKINHAINGIYGAVLGIIFTLAVTTLSGCKEIVRPYGDAEVKRADHPEFTPEILELLSEIFNNTRALRVFLPPGYYDAKNSHRSYPGLYFNDGVMVFRNDRIALGPTAEALIESGEIPPTILVGIDNGASTDKTTNPLRDRAVEYLPYPDVGPFGTDDPIPSDPQGTRFPEFVVNEVMPLVTRNYRAAFGPSNTGIAGYSYGGTAALYVVLAKPELFGRLMIESTPLWMGAKGELMGDIGDTIQWPERVYIGRGGRETEDSSVNEAGLQNIQTLANQIRTTSPQTCIKIVTDPAGEHNFAAWKSRLHVALKFLTDSGRCEKPE